MISLLASGTLVAQAFCPDRRVSIPAGGPAWNGWSPSATNTRFQPAAQAGLDPAQVSRLELKWAWGFEDDNIVFSQATAAGDTLFIGSNSGRVHALDTRTGCTRWIFRAPTGVRASIVVVPDSGGRHRLLFGDRSGAFYSLQAETGELMWKEQLDEHPAARITGAPVVNGTWCMSRFPRLRKPPRAARVTCVARSGAASLR